MDTRELAKKVTVQALHIVCHAKTSHIGSALSKCRVLLQPNYSYHQSLTVCCPPLLLNSLFPNLPS